MTNEKLTESELTYHNKVFTDLNKANQMIQFIQVAKGAAASWENHLKETYKLNQGDTISPNGDIVRLLIPNS